MLYLSDGSYSGAGLSRVLDEYMVSPDWVTIGDVEEHYPGLVVDRADGDAVWGIVMNAMDRGVLGERGINRSLNPLSVDMDRESMVFMSALKREHDDGLSDDMVALLVSMYSRFGMSAIRAAWNGAFRSLRFGDKQYDSMVAWFCGDTDGSVVEHFFGMGAKYVPLVDGKPDAVGGYDDGFLMFDSDYVVDLYAHDDADAMVVTDSMVDRSHYLSSDLGRSHGLTDEVYVRNYGVLTDSMCRTFSHYALEDIFPLIDGVYSIQYAANGLRSRDVIAAVISVLESGDTAWFNIAKRLVMEAGKSNMNIQASMFTVEWIGKAAKLPMDVFVDMLESGDWGDDDAFLYKSNLDTLLHRVNDMVLDWFRHEARQGEHHGLRHDTIVRFLDKHPRISDEINAYSDDHHDDNYRLKTVTSIGDEYVVKSMLAWKKLWRTMDPTMMLFNAVSNYCLMYPDSLMLRFIRELYKYTIQTKADNSAMSRISCSHPATKPLNRNGQKKLWGLIGKLADSDDATLESLMNAPSYMMNDSRLNQDSVNMFAVITGCTALGDADNTNHHIWDCMAKPQTEQGVNPYITPWSRCLMGMMEEIIIILDGMDKHDATILDRYTKWVEASNVILESWLRNGSMTIQKISATGDASEYGLIITKQHNTAYSQKERIVSPYNYPRTSCFLIDTTGKIPTKMFRMSPEEKAWLTKGTVPTTITANKYWTISEDMHRKYVMDNKTPINLFTPRPYYDHSLTKQENIETETTQQNLIRDYYTALGVPVPQRYQ